MVVLTTGTTLIAQIEEISTELGEPDCKIIEPYLVTPDGTVEPWLLNITQDDTFMMSSDKILTLCEPTPTLFEKYESMFEE